MSTDSCRKRLDSTPVWLSGLVAIALGSWALAQDAGPLKSDSSSPYVHRITLYDHDGGAIDPNDPQARPYSPKMTCGKCHDYATISHGWHFNANQRKADGTPLVDPGRPGEPWLWIERESGTILPLSGRGRPGTFTPAQAGVSAWQFVKRFGRHLPGGGYGELPQRELDKTPESARWNISGTLEIDCMVCHAADMRHDPAEQAQQIADENFRCAPTAALGLGVIRGQARRLPDEFDPMAPPSPDHPDQVLPKVIYDRSRFDADDRVFFDVVRNPPAERCYFCHTQRVVSPNEPPAWLGTQDVHLAAGMSCVDCHRSGIDHMDTRGFAGSGAHPAAATLTCAGCHLGPPQSGGGQSGAPYPQHAGIPTIHFERLTCTACHSGPWPEMDAHSVQTAMAHALGIASKERGTHDPPQIAAPIFAAQSDGVIAPHRLVWPSFFGRLSGDSVTPAPLAEVSKLIASARKKIKTGAGQTADDSRIADADSPLSAELMTEILTELAKKKDAGEPVHVRDGRLTRLSGTSLVTHADPVAAPYRWPLAHDVRPAQQSLGVRGCTDCHANQAPFFFGHLTPPSAKAGARSSGAAVMHEVQGVNATLARAWAFPFAYRWMMTWVGWCSVAIVLAVLMAHGLNAFRRAARE